MRPSEVYLHSALLDSVPKTGVQRRRIMNFIYRLRENPDILGDFHDKDESLRQRQIKIVGDYAVTFWFDAPARIVMVVDVRLAD